MEDLGHRAICQLSEMEGQLLYLSEIPFPHLEVLSTQQDLNALLYILMHMTLNVVLGTGRQTLLMALGQ